MRQITTVALDVTTHCNRRCVNCCAGVGINRKLQHHPWKYFERAAQVLHGIERVHLTGGEPLSSPLFDRLAAEARSMFGCRVLTVQTNGYMADRHAEALAGFDHVYLSEYGDNAEQAQFIKGRFPVTTWPHGEAGFTPRAKRGSGKPCARGFSETVAYQDGLLHGCCVGAGVDGAVGMEPVPEWREAILAHPLPCKDCFFSE